jgi:replicative DNA helicase
MTAEHDERRLRLIQQVQGADAPATTGDATVTDADTPPLPVPLTPAETLVSNRLREEPPLPEALITYQDGPFLTRGCVGGIVAAGGTGKSFLEIQLANMLAEGGTLGPLKATKPCTVLLLMGEDPQDELDRRLWRVCSGHFSEKLHAISVAGKTGPLMKLDGANPERSEWYIWLCRTIENHPGLGVLIMDPKSRFYGLDENNNDHCTQWIASLEAIANTYKITILFAHHVSKSSTGKLDQNMSRGGSAIADGVRWLVGLTKMDDKTADTYQVDSRAYIEMDLVKANYVPKLPSRMFFKRDQDGVLRYENLAMGRIQRLTQHLTELLATFPAELTRRDLRKEAAGNDIATAMKERDDKFNRSKEMDICIDHGIEQGHLSEVEVGNKKNKKTIIRVTKLER